MKSQTIVTNDPINLYNTINKTIAGKESDDCYFSNTLWIMLFIINGPDIVRATLKTKNSKHHITLDLFRLPRPRSSFFTELNSIFLFFSFFNLYLDERFSLN